MSKLVHPINIDLDRPRLLLCDFNAVTAIKRWTGRNLLTITKENADKFEGQF